MGRGRAKAKQTRVARDLKYRPVDTDFAMLQRELSGHVETKKDETPDPYSELAAQYDPGDEYEEDDKDQR